MASVRQRVSKSGQSTWAVLYRQGKRQASRTFTTEKAARDFRVLVDQFGAERALELAGASTEDGHLTVRELAHQWLAWKGTSLTPRAHGDYKRDYDKWIDPFLGHRAAAFIDERDVQGWVDKHLVPALGAKSVADKHAILHGIFKWGSAQTRRLVPRNPCRETQLPKRTKSSPRGLTLNEWLALKEASTKVGQDAADLILFMGSTGWRLGEATALTALAVEDRGSKVYVTVSHVNRRGQGVVAGAKSSAGLRRIDVSMECAAMLRRRLVGLGNNDLVFTNSNAPSGLWEAGTFRRYFYRAVDAAGLTDRKPTPHWLRHTHVVICHAAGMSLAEIQRRLGHEHIETTIGVYGRTLGEASDEVMDRLDALLSGRVDTLIRGEIVQGVLSE